MFWKPNYRKEITDFYVKEHKYYYTPSEWTADWRLSQHGFESKYVDILLEMSRFYYHKMIADKKYVEPKYEDQSKLEGKDLEKAQQKEGFYESLWNKSVPGNTPFEKALNTLIIMRKKQKKDGKKGDMGFDPDGMSGEELESTWDGVPDETQFDNKNMNDLFAERPELEDFSIKMDMLQRIAIVEGFGKSFEIKKTVEEHKVPFSRVYKPRRMTEFSEVVNAQPYQKLLPNYLSKLLSKDLVINSPIETEESKQKIIILVDYSGSMRSGNKQNWVLSILADRLAYCMDEECEIFFSYFLTKRELEDGYFKWTHIYNRETALNFFKSFSIGPNGGIE